MDDFLLPPPSDLSDCLVEAHILKQEAIFLDDYELVNFVSQYSDYITITEETQNAISNYFNKGRLSKTNRDLIENCYVLLKNYLCIGLDGQIYQTLMVDN